VETRLRVPGPVSVTGGIDHGPSVPSSVKIYEIVAGARLHGRTVPGGRVVAELPLEAAATRRHFRYRTTARADASGDFALRVPYPTERPHGESDVTARAGYVIAVERGDGSRRPIAQEVRVPFAAVREGLEIEVSETAD
jgi:hypothetical protein